MIPINRVNFDNNKYYYQEKISQITNKNAVSCLFFELSKA